MIFDASISPVAKRALLPPSIICAGGLVGFWVFAALFAPWIAPYDPNAVDVMHALQAPGAEHWLGTDQVGRDVLSRVLYGAQIDLLMCLAGVLPSLVIGTTIGLVSGYYGGVIDTVLMRLYDLTAAFPFFVLVLAIVGVLGPGLLGVRGHAFDSYLAAGFRAGLATRLGRTGATRVRPRPAPARTIARRRRRFAKEPRRTPSSPSPRAPGRPRRTGHR